MEKRVVDQEFIVWPVLFEESSNDDQHSSLEFNKSTSFSLEYYKDILGGGSKPIIFCVQFRLLKTTAME